MIKFLTEPKNFKEPHNQAGFDIVAIGVQIPKQEISFENTISLEFLFFIKNEENQIIEHSRILKTNIYKKVVLPNGVQIDFVSGLLSYDKMKVFQTASLFAMSNGYTLKPIEEQIELNQMI